VLENHLEAFDAQREMLAELVRSLDEESRVQAEAAREVEDLLRSR